MIVNLKLGIEFPKVFSNLLKPLKHLTFHSLRTPLHKLGNSDEFELKFPELSWTELKSFRADDFDFLAES